MRVRLAVQVLVVQLAHPAFIRTFRHLDNAQMDSYYTY